MGSGSTIIPSQQRPPFSPPPISTVSSSYTMPSTTIETQPVQQDVAPVAPVADQDETTVDAIDAETPTKNSTTTTEKDTASCESSISTVVKKFDKERRRGKRAGRGT
jgi:hypothetical protein